MIISIKETNGAGSQSTTDYDVDARCDRTCVVATQHVFVSCTQRKMNRKKYCYLKIYDEFRNREKKCWRIGGVKEWLPHTRTHNENLLLCHHIITAAAAATTYAKHNSYTHTRERNGKITIALATKSADRENLFGNVYKIDRGRNVMQPHQGQRYSQTLTFEKFSLGYTQSFRIGRLLMSQTNIFMPNK